MLASSLNTRDEDFQLTPLVGGYRSRKCQKSPACGQEAARKKNPIYAKAVAVHGADRAEEAVVPFRDRADF
jgi:hypothetical protein